ncbi:transcription antitermination protein NusB [Frigoriflavimonas asaccharolytica]|uniref:N utilization substance protein B n=1 Tax=Frigoriflavimonas asaccharolytica TaxID=2735899 RepID=A0A8J8K9U6_9FLAO|nr:transcription antitermination factor NusB [Frigoriflavimonas asaccharolytica]NRS93467.1 N utilization substance protein B [Frigoriflavimonas asaccharolytica]
MLGRRQIREKVIESLYGNIQNPLEYDFLERNMLREIDKIYHLYIYQLNFLLSLKEVAEKQMEIGKAKYIKDDNEDAPNRKFVDNKVLLQLEANAERIVFTGKHKDLQWDLQEHLLVSTFQKIKKGKRYQDFMNLETSSYLEDQKFIGKLFLRYIAENEDFHAHLEEKELSWASDFHIANSMFQKTIGFLKEDEESHTLIKTIKDDEDRDFAKKLLNESVKHWDETEGKLKDKLINWELDRISLMDKIIIIAAITELDYFPLTPTKVLLNEYIEISKVFSTEKSNVFVNGILDKYTKEINRI